MYRGQRAYGALLAMVAIAILVIGFRFKPKAQNSGTKQLEITTIQSEMDRLREFAQRNSLRNASARFAEAAHEAILHAMIVSPQNRPGWMIAADQTVVVATDANELPTGMQVSKDGETFGAVPTSWGAGLPFVALRPEGSTGVVAAKSIAVERVGAGAWVLLVSMSPSGGVKFSPGNFSGMFTVPCGFRDVTAAATNIPLDEDSVGAGMFDMDGNLLAVVLRCEDRLAAVPMAALSQLTSAANDRSSGMFARLGMRVTAIDDEWKEVTGRANGIIVTDVWKDWPAGMAGLQAGDIVARVNGNAVQSVGEMTSAMSEGPEEIELLRRGRIVQCDLSAVGTGVEKRGVELRTALVGVELAHVTKESSAGKAGLAAGDAIISVNGVRARAADLERYLSPMNVEKPLLVVGKRRERTFARVVAP